MTLHDFVNEPPEDEGYDPAQADADQRAEELDATVRKEAEAFSEWLCSLESDKHREHALEILWDDICPECAGADPDGKFPRPCNCVGHRAKAEVNAEAALHWALDILARQDTRLIELGDPAELVLSPIYQRGKEMSRQALRDLAAYSGCCHRSDGEPASPRRSAFVPGGLRHTLRRRRAPSDG